MVNSIKGKTQVWSFTSKIKKVFNEREWWTTVSDAAENPVWLGLRNDH